jgi:hypothetical protein
MNNSLSFSSIQRPTRFHTSVKNMTSLIHTTTKIATASGKGRRVAQPINAQLVIPVCDTSGEKNSIASFFLPSRPRRRSPDGQLWRYHQLGPQPSACTDVAARSLPTPPVPLSCPARNAYCFVPNGRSHGAALLAGHGGGARHTVLGARPCTEFPGFLSSSYLSVTLSRTRIEIVSQVRKLWYQVLAKV